MKLMNFHPKTYKGHPNGPFPHKKGPFHILCLSGGGYLSLYTALVLANLEKRTGKPLHHNFDLIAGTSAGGILAMAVSIGVPMNQFAKLFAYCATRIFEDEKPKSRMQNLRDTFNFLFNSKYDNNELKTLLTQFLPETFTMADIGKRLLIPAYNMTKASPHSLRTHYLQNQSHAGHWKARDVCMATSAAPLFFPLYKANNDLYADGALYANTPDTLALHEAGLMGIPDHQIWMLSIGTSAKHPAADPNGRTNWGLKDWIQNQMIIKAAMTSQELASQRQVRQRLKKRYLRLDNKPPDHQAKCIGVDIANVNARKILKNLAADTINKLDHRIEYFLNHQASPTILGPGTNSLSPWDDLTH